jgi:hypothetical protein
MNICILNADYETGPWSYSLYLSITEHKPYVLDRSDKLDIGNKNIVLYRIEFMPAIHSPSRRWYCLIINQ